MITIKILFYSLSSLLVLFFAISMMMHYKKKKYQKYLLFFLFLVLSWVVINALNDTLLDQGLVTFFLQIAVIPGAFILNLFYLFTLSFPREDKKITWRAKLVIFLPSFFIAFLSFTSWNVVSVEVDQYRREFVTGPLYVLLLVDLLIFLGLSIRELARKHITIQNRIYKKQIKSFIFIITVNFLIGILTNVVLVMMGLEEYAFLGQFAVIIFVLSLSYISLQHELLFSTKKARAFLLHAVPLVFTVVLYLSVIILFKGGNGQAVIVSSSLAVVLLMGVLSYIFVKRNSFDVVKESELQFERSLEYPNEEDLLSNSEVVKKARGYFNSLLKIESGSVLILESGSLNRESRLFHEHTHLNKSETVSLINRFPSSQDIFYTDMEEISLDLDNSSEEQYKKKDLISFLRKKRIDLVVPFSTRENLLGLSIFSLKKGAILSKKQLYLVGVFAKEITIDIQKVQQYISSKDNEKRLSEEVKKKTIEVSKQNKKLKKIAEEKIAFSHMVNHQIREPLSNINNYISLLRDKKIDEIESGKVENYIRIVASYVDQLDKKAHDLLFF